MRLLLIYIILLLSSLNALTYDCSNVKPFIPNGQQIIKIAVSRFTWSQGEQVFEEVCNSSSTIKWYDVRGREEEAYYCLKPEPNEVGTCKTMIGSEPAEIEIVPASWIRTWQPNSRREYRFHAYIIKEANPNFYYDIFSRSLTENLISENIIIEGALKTGPGNPDDGFWVHVEFLK